MDCLSPDVLPCTFEELVGRAEAIGTNRGEPEIVALYRWWIAADAGLSRSLHAAWFDLGVELGCASDREGAIQAYRQAAALAPHFAPAAINLGLSLERDGEDEFALGAWARACQDDESRAALLNNQARLLERKCRLLEAEAKLRASLRTSPAQPDVIQHWVHARQKLCAWPVMDSLAVGIEPTVLEAHCGPLAVLALTDDIAVQTRVAAGWIARKTTPTAERLAPAEGYGHGRLRIGYLSSDFCRHAMSFLIAEFFERHDRTRFDIYGYCSTLDDGSDIRRRVIAAFDHCRFIRDMPDEAAARLIRTDEIDVLIDLNGLTQGARLQILRWRPAPVQATYLGLWAQCRYRNLTTCSATMSWYLRRWRRSTAPRRSPSARHTRPMTASGRWARPPHVQKSACRRMAFCSAAFPITTRLRTRCLATGYKSWWPAQAPSSG